MPAIISNGQIYSGVSTKTVIIENGGGGAGTTNYNDLTNKPKINGVELTGNKTTEDLGLTESIELTQAEYDALEEDGEVDPDTTYFIKDGNPTPVPSATISPYPIGSVYISFNSTNPSEFFGGEWEQIQGKFLLATDDDHEVESTGGEEEHVLTVNEMPSHNHNIVFQSYVGSGLYNVAGTSAGGQASASTAAIGQIGSSQPHNNMPPYIAVYMWRRTA